MSENDKFQVLTAPNPPLFFNQKERDLVKHINDEIAERIIGTGIVYHSVSLEHTNFHSLYGEAIKKSFLPPLHIYALVEWTEDSSTTTSYGVDTIPKIKVNFQKRRINEDKNIDVRIGDFIFFNNNYFEIIKTYKPKLLFGQAQEQFEISAECVKARQDLFDSK